MSNPNFVSDLVAMAKAFEELPQVKAELAESERARTVGIDMIQRLELRLMDLKNEVDAAHAATRRMEVERDHAERMFLETDDRLNAFRRLVQAFDTDVKSLVKAEEPEPASAPTAPAEVLPSVDPVTEPQGESAVDPTASTNDGQTQHLEQPQTQAGTVPTVEPLSNAPQGERVMDPTTAPTPNLNDSSPTEHSAVSAVESSSANAPEVASPSDPTLATLDAPQVPASSFVNAGETSATTETAGLTQHEEAPQERPVDPTVSATHIETGPDALSTGVAENSAVSTSSTTEQSSTSSNAVEDDVGYHNEPKIIGTGAEAWAAWDDWCARMTKRYPSHLGGWPARTA